MDINDLPRQIMIPIIPGGSNRLFKHLTNCGMKCVVYNAEEPLTKAELEEVLSFEKKTLDDMGIASLDPPIVNMEKAGTIAEYISRQMHQTDIKELANATNWTIVPTANYKSEKEVRLSLIVTP